MRRILRLSLLLAVLCAAALVPGRAAAQGADSAGLLRLRRACAGSLAHVTTTSGQDVRGRCGPVDDARLVVQDSAGRVWELPYAGIESVRVRRSGARRGAAVGGVAGGVVLGAWVGLVASALCSGDGGSGCGRDAGLATLAGAGVGALGGAGIGAAVGSATRVWVRVHP